MPSRFFLRLFVKANTVAPLVILILHLPVFFNPTGFKIIHKVLVTYLTLISYSLGQVISWYALPETPVTSSRSITMLHPDARIPVKKYESDAGYDVFLVEDVSLKPFSSVRIPLGFGIQIKQGQMLTVRSRSSTKMRGVSCTQTTCDAGYTGQLHGFLINHTNQHITFSKGDRVVQLVFLTLAPSSVLRQGILPLSSREGQGFGSTGSR